MCSVCFAKWISQKCRKTSKAVKSYPVEVEGIASKEKTTGPSYEVMRLYETIPEVSGHQPGKEPSFADSLNCDSRNYVPMTIRSSKCKPTAWEGSVTISTGTGVPTYVEMSLPTDSKSPVTTGTGTSTGTGTVGYVDMSLLIPQKMEGDLEEHADSLNRPPTYGCKRNNLPSTEDSH